MDSMTSVSSEVQSISLLGSYIPRQCGIATFTKDLHDAIVSHLDNNSVNVQALDDTADGYNYPPEVTYQIPADQIKPYRTAADTLNIQQSDIVIVQHEYGIFGGVDGDHVTHFMRHLRMPIITTLHTVLSEPTPGQHAVMQRIAELSDRLVVMSHLAERILQDVYAVNKNQIAYIPHGIPDIHFVDPFYHKERFDVEGRKVLLTFGLLSPGKGIEVAIRALPRVVEKYPQVIYIVLGATHPHELQKMGNDYRHSLTQLTRELGVENHVRFHEQFVEQEELVRYISAADIYLTPYHNKAQITSGTLAYALGAGKAVVSTPYWYAQEMLANGRGKLFDFGNHDQLADSLIQLLDDDATRDTMRKKAYQHCRPMVWNEVGRSYLQLANQVLAERSFHPRPILPMQADSDLAASLPQANLNHLRTMTDDTGIFQHAKCAVPDRNHGYCIDDNARALIAALMYRSLYSDQSVIKLVDIYQAFIYHAFNQDKKGFHNFMSYDRRWLDEIGSQDSQGRTIWAIGAAIEHASNDTSLTFAVSLMQKALPVIEQLATVRSWSFAILGLDAYLQKFAGDRRARQLFGQLATCLYNQFIEHAQPQWPWCEKILTYDNGKIPHALIAAGCRLNDEAMINQGLKSLDWLIDTQSNEHGRLSLIGNAGWMLQGQPPARFDQQPVDAMAIIQACNQAYDVTEDRQWIAHARRALRWFMGGNDTGSMIYDAQTGGCRDGLQQSGPNLNQGAESTLAWLISLMTVIKLSRSDSLDKSAHPRTQSPAVVPRPTKPRADSATTFKSPAATSDKIPLTRSSQTS